MMWCNAASLMAGGGAVYLNFDTGSTQNIIASLISSAVAFTNLVGELQKQLHRTKGSPNKQDTEGIWALPV